MVNLSCHKSLEFLAFCGFQIVRPSSHPDSPVLYYDHHHIRTHRFCITTIITSELTGFVGAPLMATGKLLGATFVRHRRRRACNFACARYPPSRPSPASGGRRRCHMPLPNAHLAASSSPIYGGGPRRGTASTRFTPFRSRRFSYVLCIVFRHSPN
ncbi:hypothetical protein PMI17_03610, partial [Pantoea sp. GM01]